MTSELVVDKRTDETYDTQAKESVIVSLPRVVANVSHTTDWEDDRDKRNQFTIPNVGLHLNRLTSVVSVIRKLRSSQLIYTVFQIKFVPA